MVVIPDTQIRKLPFATCCKTCGVPGPALAGRTVVNHKKDAMTKYQDPWGHLPTDGHTFYHVTDKCELIHQCIDEWQTAYKRAVDKARKAFRRVIKDFRDQLKDHFKVECTHPLRRSTKFEFAITTDIKGWGHPEFNEGSRYDASPKARAKVKQAIDKLPLDFRKTWNIKIDGSVSTCDTWCVVYVSLRPFRNNPLGKAKDDELTRTLVSTTGRGWYAPVMEEAIPSIQYFWSRYVAPKLEASAVKKLNAAGRETSTRDCGCGELRDLGHISLFRPDATGPWLLVQPVPQGGITVDLTKLMKGLKRLKMSQYWRMREKLAEAAHKEDTCD